MWRAWMSATSRSRSSVTPSSAIRVYPVDLRNRRRSSRCLSRSCPLPRAANAVAPEANERIEHRVASIREQIDEPRRATKPGKPRCDCGCRIPSRRAARWWETPCRGPASFARSCRNRCPPWIRRAADPFCSSCASAFRTNPPTGTITASWFILNFTASWFILNLRSLLNCSRRSRRRGSDSATCRDRSSSYATRTPRSTASRARAGRGSVRSHACGARRVSPAP